MKFTGYTDLYVGHISVKFQGHRLNNKMAALYYVYDQICKFVYYYSSKSLIIYKLQK